MVKLTLLTVRNNEPYPKCGVELVIRSRKHGLPLGRSQCPACDYVHSLRFSADGHIVRVLEGQVYPARGADLVLRQGRFGVFISCNSYPEYKHTELIDKPDETAITCPQCRTSRLVQHRFHYGKTFHSCDRYPECQFVINPKPITGKYLECHYPLFVEKKTAQGVKHSCASKQCGKPISAE